MSGLPFKILNWGFRRYVRRFVRKHFNAVRVQGQEQLAELADGPLVCFANHPGWWDPMTAVLMTDLLFPGRRFAAPMDAEALRLYPILERLGFFSVERDTTSGAREFLRTSRQLLKNPQTLLWLTPSGKFHDIRQPASFMSGLGHLLNSDFPGAALPMAIEYTFWNERSPELLVRFGSPVSLHSLAVERDARTIELEKALTATQALLAEHAVARDPAGFTTLAMGQAGIGGLYDFWRRMIANLRGQKFVERHSHQHLVSTKAVNGELT
jgi:1-acyl-sn-glycerol-3-phosphate acyltransferase